MDKETVLVLSHIPDCPGLLRIDWHSVLGEAPSPLGEENDFSLDNLRALNFLVIVLSDGVGPGGGLCL